MTTLSLCDKFTKLYTYDLDIFLYACYIRRNFYFKKKTVIILGSSFSHISHLDQHFLLALIQNLYKIWPFLTTSQLLILCKPNNIFLNLFQSFILVFLLLPLLPTVCCQYSHHSELFELNWIVLLPTKSSNWFLIFICNKSQIIVMTFVSEWSGLPSPYVLLLLSFLIHSTPVLLPLYASQNTPRILLPHDIYTAWMFLPLDSHSLFPPFLQVSAKNHLCPWPLSLQFPPLTDNFLFLFCSIHQICTQCQYEQLLVWCSGQKINKIGKDYSLHGTYILAGGDKKQLDEECKRKRKDEFQGFDPNNQNNGAVSAKIIKTEHTANSKRKKISSVLGMLCPLFCLIFLISSYQHWHNMHFTCLLYIFSLFYTLECNL